MTRHELTEHVLIIQAYSKLLLVAKTQVDFNYAKHKIKLHSDILHLTDLEEVPETETEIALAVSEDQPNDNPMPRTE